jgi:Resolvase, N terminal domain
MAKPRKVQKRRRPKNERLRDKPRTPLIGYMRVSKADGSQVLDLQRDAMRSAGVTERHLYSDAASGKKDDRLGLAACLRALREGDTLVVWKLDRPVAATMLGDDIVDVRIDLDARNSARAFGLE